MQIVVTDLDVFESVLGIIVFDETMLDTGLFRVREKIFPVDGSLADVSEMSRKFDRARCSTVAAGGMGIVHVILHMNEGEAAGIIIEIRDRIFSGNGDPAEIHFHNDEFGISFGKKKIVR